MQEFLQQSEKHITPEPSKHTTGRIEHSNPEEGEKNRHYESDRVP